MSHETLVHVPPSLCQGSGHQTALHRSAMVGNSEATAALIQGGCALDLQSRDGNTALHEASWHGFSQCIKLLVRAGANVHIRNKAGNTALHLACQNAHAQTARLLLIGGSIPDAKNNMGDTCLHVAARYNNLALVKILLGSFCSVTERNKRGDTALHVTAALNHKKCVQLLLEAGTDGMVRNNEGKTALDKARDNNHKEVALLLARAPKVHRFLRGRTIRKPRTQSVTRAETLQNNDNGSVMGGTPGSGQRERTLVKVLNENDLTKCRSEFHREKDLLCGDDGNRSTQGGKTYQLYTLYRDKEGNIRQAPAGSCHCKPLLKKLEGQLKATQGEMRLHILNIHEQVDSRLVKMDRRNRHQIKVLDMLNQERAAAERKNIIYKMEQEAAKGREETLTSQAALRHELKRWCTSQLKDMDVHMPAEPQYYKLQPSPSVEQSVAEADLESLPLLSVLSGDSSTSLATYVNILPFKPNNSAENSQLEQIGSRTYFEMKMNTSPDNYENTALCPLPAKPSSGFMLGSADPPWQHPGVQDNAIAAVVPLCGEGFSSSSQSRIHTDSTTTLEFFIDRPSEPTFSQERKNLHAIEVTQRFFETVSTQLEHWCERKILEVEQQTELRAQQDRKELLQRITMLEEEIQRLTTNENAES
ncbi:ankyrin repeat domain-containing protein 6 [Parambassis ranga]|uniref:Ankyrin repeat domain-containing protein 6 n=1 Tax=Parambassis ranga TaxID=210632 RepID=A0A6P7HTD5_9TELE|nr:ankyrin repeat domain-containing protein 6-like [Parambassis ranga]